MDTVNNIIEFYKKTKKDWDKFSSVRSSNNNYDLKIEELENKERLSWHLSESCEILQHQDLKSLTEDKKKFIMGVQLLEYVEKTTLFEVEYVNKVANDLALSKLKFNLPDELKVDAFKIYTDEGYHAHFSKKMSNEIKSFYKIEDDLNPYINNFFQRIDGIGSKFDKKYKYLSELSSTIVSETTIVQDMSEQMKGVVYAPIREMFKDHIIDETFHSNYFTTLIKILWPQMSIEEKEIMGFNLCESMVILGKPRTDIFFYSLGRIGYDNSQISKFIDEVYNDPIKKIKKRKKKFASTLKLLERIGVFKIDTVKKEFEKEELI